MMEITMEEVVIILRDVVVATIILVKVVADVIGESYQDLWVDVHVDPYKHYKCLIFSLNNIIIYEK